MNYINQLTFEMLSFIFDNLGLVYMFISLSKLLNVKQVRQFYFQVMIDNDDL